MDNFEKQLQRQNFRQVPAEWREEILAAARAPAQGLRTHIEEPAGWGWLFARFPVAWGALGMLWATLIAVNLLMSASGTRTTTQPVFAAGAEPMALLNLQRAEVSLLNVGLEGTMAPGTVSPLSPRHERRRDGGHGAFLAQPPTHFFA